MSEAEGKKGGGWFRWVKLVFSFALGLGLLVLIFHDVDMDRFVGAIRDVDKVWWIICFASFLTLHVSRAWRWGRIVNQVHPVSFRHVFSINSVGFLAIQALPFRLGEFARPYLLHERTDAPFGASMYSVVVERTIDILCLAVMFYVAVIFADLPEAIVIGGVEMSFVADGQKAIAFTTVPFVGCLLAFLVLQDRAVRWADSVVGMVHKGLAHKVAGMMQSFLDGVRTMKDARFALSMVTNSVFIWVLNVLCMWSLCKAFHFDHIGLMGGLVLLVVLVVGVMLPAPPLFAGVFEAFIIGGLALLHVDKDSGAAYAVVCHVTQTVIIFGFGLFFLWVDQISFSKIIDHARSVTSMAPAGSPDEP